MSDETLESTETVLPDGWRGVIAGLDRPTGDSRYLATPQGGVRTREYPLTLTLQHVGEGVDIPIGNVERVWVEGGMLHGEGRFDLESEEGRDAARRLAEGFVNTVSIHPDQLTAMYALLKEDGSLINMNDIKTEEEYYELREAGAKEIVVFQDWRLAGLAVVSIPAYTEARIEAVFGYEKGEPSSFDALVAAVGGQVFNSEFFQNPKLTGPTKLTVLDNGHVYGHVALWDSCYQYGGPGAGSTCTKPPHSPSNYSEFHVHSANVGGGESIACGVITYGDGHVSKGGLKASRDQINNVAHQAAKVVAGEDKFGVWVSGEILDAVRDEATDILNSPLSGHWEPNPQSGGALDMIGAHIVNVPGFRISPIVASFGDGFTLDGLTLTMLEPTVSAEEELADKIADAVIAKLAQKEIDHKAATKAIHAAALKARIGADASKERAAKLAARLSGI